MESKIFSQFDATLKHPFSMIISGPSQSGKSVFIKQFIFQCKTLMDLAPDYFVWFYGIPTTQHQEIKQYLQNKIKFISHLPVSIEEYIVPNQRGMIIIDDLMDESSSSNLVSNLFVKGVHHYSISLMFTSQNLFSSGSKRINFLRNAQYYVLFKFPLDMTIPNILSRRVFAHNPTKFIQIFHEATKDDFGYLFCDGHQTTPNYARFRSKIFDGWQMVYLCEN
jgi:hypothetical protein